MSLKSERTWIHRIGPATLHIIDPTDDGGVGIVQIPVVGTRICGIGETPDVCQPVCVLYQGPLRGRIEAFSVVNPQVGYLPLVEDIRRIRICRTGPAGDSVIYRPDSNLQVYSILQGRHHWGPAASDHKLGQRPSSSLATDPPALVSDQIRSAK